jgi:Domain of unknown function (DUF4381)
VNPQDPLASLHPLRQPELIGWWPLAPGWWVLLGLLLITLAILIYLLRRRSKRNAYRRQALRQLQLLQTQFQANSDTGVFVQQTNALLKSVAMQAYPRVDVAAQHGETWRLFLNRSLQDADQLQSDFDTAMYQKDCPQIDAVQVHRAAQRWIKRHRAAL